MNDSFLFKAVHLYVMQDNKSEPNLRVPILSFVHSSSNVATIKALVSSQTLFSLNNDKSDLTMTQPTKGSSLKQVAAAVFANLGNVNTGMVFGFSAAATSQLISRDSPYRITSDESTWIGEGSLKGTR